MTTQFDETVAAVQGAIAFMKRNHVKPVRECTYERRTYAGMRNRWLRDRGRGERLYRVEENQYFFEGFDREDYRLYLNLVEEKLPHFIYYEDIWVYDVIQWLTTHAIGEYRHTFNPMFVTGGVQFSDQNDAFFFKMTFSRPKSTGRGQVSQYPSLDFVAHDNPVMKFVERKCLRPYFFVVDYVKSWIGGRDEPVRSR